MFENIPAELRNLPHWVAAGPDKIPVNPRTGKYADHNDPGTGGTFAEAVHCGLKHVGFILSDLDPYAIIDLDDPYERVVAGVRSPILPNDPDYPEAVLRSQRHDLIYENFPTYAELSQSGKGVHLVMKGIIPCPVKREKVEIYQKQRYMIFTGNVIRQAPVSNCQEQIDWIYSTMRTMIRPTGELIEEEETVEDSKIWEIATNAKNGADFVSLCEGEWQTMKRANGLARYGSQSDADFGLCNMLAFYSRSNEQVIRMFRQTALGQRPKAQRDDYFRSPRYGMLTKIRAEEVPLVDTSKLLPVPEAPREQGELFSDLPAIGDDLRGKYTFPPGIVGDVAEYILSSAIRPVPEVALAAAISICAGVCARSYNISNNGLNQYIIVLAKTGRGKEGAASGIDNLIAAVRMHVPSIDDFVGPAAFASGQALVKVLDRHPCFVSVLGEFGLTLQQICEPNAPGPMVMLKKVLLDIFGKSGRSKVLRSSVYSDSDKNTKIIQAPNVSLLGESTPETFFGGLDVSHIAEGLIPRFMVFEYHGKRPPPNENAFHPPSEDLVKRFAQLVNSSVTMAQNNTCAPVSITPEARRVFDHANAEADNRINADGLSAETELYNRFHLKIMKLAALVAVGINPMAPVISGDVAEWAAETVRLEVSDMMAHFQSGDVGTGEGKQEAEIIRLFKHFQTLSPKQRRSHRCPEGLIGSQCVTLTFLTIYTRRLGCFRQDKRGESRALRETLADMIGREVLEPFSPKQLEQQFGSKAPIYIPGAGWG